MDVRNGFIDSIGNTPLIRLNRVSDATGCEILGKAEFMNPGGSVKDRAALAIVKDAVAKGLLRPGGVIVEGTAGNTGIGLALVANALGYRTVIVIPETQTQEKKDMLRLCGADLREVPAVPYRDPGNYVKFSGRLAEEIAAKEPAGAIWANQFDNVANKQGHYETTGGKPMAKSTASSAQWAPAARWPALPITCVSRSPACKSASLIRQVLRCTSITRMAR
jgi:cysteine synthase